MKTVRSLCVLALGLGLSLICAHAEDNPEKVAATAAQAWLRQVDAGSYAASWKEASAYFKGAVTEKAWAESLNGVRRPLGKLVSRKLKNGQYTKSVPGAPDGDYVVMQLETSFENKKAALETVTFMRDNDSQWRAAGYYIK